MIVSKVNGKEVSYSSLYASAEEENTKALSGKNTSNPENSTVNTMGNSADQKIEEKQKSPIETRKEDSQKKVFDNIQGKDEDKKVYDNIQDEDDGISSHDYKLSYDGKASSIMNSFESLAAAMGVSDNKITKSQLLAYLQTLAAESTTTESITDKAQKSKEIAFVKGLIARFDTLSDGGDYITSLNQVNEPQDYETVTPQQLQSPIEILI